MTAPLLYHEEAEQGVLGAMLLEHEAALVAGSVLKPEDFAREIHRTLFSAMLAVAERGAKVDHITIRDELEGRGGIEKAGGIRYLALLVDAVASPGNVEHHAQIIRNYAVRRELLAQSQAAATFAQDMSRDPTETVSGVVDQLVRIAHPAAAAPEKAFKSQLWDVLQEVERQAEAGDEVTGLPSGIARLDHVTDGWEKGRLIVVAARPKQGKTGFALHCAAETCRAESSVYFATAEQPSRELTKRLVGMESQVPLRSVRTEQTLDMVATKLARAAGELAQWPIIIDQVSRTPAQVRFGVQRRIAEFGAVDLVIVDYLGKFHSGSRHERHDLEIGSMTSAFAQLAMDLNVPVILLVQLNRESVRGGQIRRPTPSDLRDSGAIEQDAAQLLFLYRDEKAEEAQKDPNWLQVIVELNRFGPTGVADVVFEKATGRWHQALRLAS